MKHVILITALFMITALAPAKEVKTGALTLNIPDTWVVHTKNLIQNDFVTFSLSKELKNRGLVEDIV